MSNQDEINSLFEQMKEHTADLRYACFIRNRMNLHGITFSELNFTEVEFEREKRRTIIGYINSLFEKLQQTPNDMKYGEYIRFWLKSTDVTFSELNFTEAEFETEKKRTIIRHINDLFVSLKKSTTGKDGAASITNIRRLMKRHNITFSELTFTKTAFKAKKQKIKKA